MKKIVIIIRTPDNGGNSRSAIHIYNALKNYFDIKIIVFEDDKHNYLNIKKENIYSLRTPTSNNYIIKIFHTIVRLIRLKKYLKKEKIELAYFIIDQKNVLTKLKYKHVKKVISCRDCKHLFEYSNLFHKNLKKSDYLVFNSKYMENYYLNKFTEDNKKTSTIYNIVDQTFIKTESKINLNEIEEKFFNEHYTIISVGRFCNEKGFTHLIKTFTHLQKIDSKFGLCIVGDGILMQQIREMIKLYDLEKDVLLTGYCDPPFKYILKSKIFVLSSITEGFPNVLLEAIALEIPVVSTNCTSGPIEILNPSNLNINIDGSYYIGEYGILTPPFQDNNNDINDKNEKIMAEAINKLKNDKNLYDTYRSRSKICIKNYDTEIIGSQYLKLFNYLLNKNN